MRTRHQPRSSGRTYRRRAGTTSSCRRYPCLARETRIGSRTSTATSDPPNATIINIVLASTAGYVDTVGFVALSGFFSAHVTGNLVLIGSELAAPSHGVLIKLLAFPAFIAAVILARFIVLGAGRSRRSTAARPLMVQAMLLVGFMYCGTLALPGENAQSGLALAAGVLGAGAMGLQSATGRLVWPSLAPTTAMTSNVTELVIDLVDMFRSGGDTELQRRAYKFLWPVLSFGAGAILGAFAFRHFLFHALVLPITAVAWLTLLTFGASPMSSRNRPQEST